MGTGAWAHCRRAHSWSASLRSKKATNRPVSRNPQVVAQTVTVQVAIERTADGGSDADGSRRGLHWFPSLKSVKSSVYLNSHPKTLSSASGFGPGRPTRSGRSRTGPRPGRERLFVRLGVALFRAKGATTLQPRATPWGLDRVKLARPEGAELASARHATGLRPACLQHLRPVAGGGSFEVAGWGGRQPGLALAGRMAVAVVGFFRVVGQ